MKTIVAILGLLMAPFIAGVVFILLAPTSPYLLDIIVCIIIGLVLLLFRRASNRSTDLSKQIAQTSTLILILALPLCLIIGIGGLVAGPRMFIDFPEARFTYKIILAVIFSVVGLGCLRMMFSCEKELRKRLEFKK